MTMEGGHGSFIYYTEGDQQQFLPVPACWSATPERVGVSSSMRNAIPLNKGIPPIIRIALEKQ
jgi:hypothetical protein